MSRKARVVVPGVPHHITQRSIRGCDVFRDLADRELYAKLIIESCRLYQILIRAYCWMTNHIHIIAVPLLPDSFAKAFRRAHSVYARVFNKKYGLRGYLWQDRFYSAPLDESHFWNAVRYVERNPVRVALVTNAEDYLWSSALSHCSGRPDALLDTDWPMEGWTTDWSEWLKIPNETSIDKLIRERTFSGLPIGDESFVRRMEELEGRVLRPQRPGRKLRPKVEDAKQELLVGLE